jgi:hypothetical protein
MSDQDQPLNLPAALIIPGRGWTRFTYTRADMELLGIVQMGMQIGALAKLSSGGYAQVNGDFIAPLDTAHLQTALDRAGLSARAAALQAGTISVRAPTVTIKKRRRVAVSAD